MSSSQHQSMKDFQARMQAVSHAADRAMNEDLAWPFDAKPRLCSRVVFDPCSSGNLPISPTFLLESSILKRGEAE